MLPLCLHDRMLRDHSCRFRWAEGDTSEFPQPRGHTHHASFSMPTFIEFKKKKKKTQTKVKHEQAWNISICPLLLNKGLKVLRGMQRKANEVHRNPGGCGWVYGIQKTCVTSWGRHLSHYSRGEKTDTSSKQLTRDLFEFIRNKKYYQIFFLLLS